MTDIVNAVAQRTGLPPDQARAAVEAVISHLKTRLPGPLASHLDSILGESGTAPAGQQAPAQGSGGGGLGGLAGELGGLFGKK